MNTRENFWNVYCFAINQMRDETARLTDNRQTAALISHNFMRDNNLAFSSTRNLQFYHLQILKFFFLDSGFGKIDINDILWKSDAKSRRQDQLIRHCLTERLRARKNGPITSNVPLCLFHVQIKRSC